MRKTSLLSGVLVFLFLSSAEAQEFRHCATDEMVEEAYRNFPELRRNKEILDSISLLPDNQKVSGTQMTTKVIPVVVHVIHNYGAENVSKAQVLDAIRIVNEDFKKMNSDTTLVDPLFSNIIGNANVEFRLAGLDPQGNCTEGITRTASGLTFSASDNVKALSAWPANRYLNIWVVNTIASGAGGYAYYPGSAPPGADGIVVRASQFGSIGASGGGNFASRTLTHEIGHYLNLRHTWGNSNNPGLATNCNIDDDVTDTPNTEGTVGQTCNFSQITCGSTDNVNNYMDYSNCGRMFTVGQATRMDIALNSGTGSRNNLWSTSNRILTGTNDGFVANICKPIADFNTSGSLEGCQGFNVNFINRTFNAPIDSISFTWVFSGGTPSTSNLVNPAVNYGTPGIYPVKLIASTTGGADSIIRTDYIKVFPTSASVLTPFIQEFENPLLFQVGSIDERWHIEKPLSSNLTWQLTNTVSYNGQRSMFFPGFNAPNGQTHSFISPPFSTSGASGSVTSTFKVAYARRTLSPVVDDVLKVLASASCGVWLQRFSKFGSQIYSDSNIYSSQFIPATQGQWKTEQFTIFPSVASYRVKFEFTTAGGQNIFIDDINIGGFVLKLSDFEYEGPGYLSLRPNPSSLSGLELVINSSAHGSKNISVWDVSGKNISPEARIHLNEGNNVIKIHELTGAIPAGIYFLKVSDEYSQQSLKMVITE